MENNSKVTLQLNLSHKDAVSVILTRLKDAVELLEQAFDNLKYGVEWFGENRDSIAEFLKQAKDARELLLEVDQNLDENGQLLARLLMVQGASFIPVPEEAANDGLLDKALEDLQNQDNKPEKDK